ncbi:MAG: hypothetical protein PWP27_2526 [Clostridiales bacterium]|jgi:hypothetical protein|nr:hypothetical protein [Clostridiales bacterium]MDK2934716.1 hypothetical protein [Clostridiales bacterium]
MKRFLTVNNLIHWEQEDSTERILWIDNQNTDSFVIDIFANVYSPVLRNIDEVIDCLNTRRAVLLTEDPWAMIIHERELKEKDKKKRDEVWEIISFIINECGEPDIFNAHIRSKVVNEASEKFSISSRTVYEYLKRFWQRGKTINALLPDYYRCGGMGREKNSGIVKRGRPRKGTKDAGINIDEKTKEIFIASIKRFYYTSQKNSLRTVYELMRKEFYTSSYRYENNIRKPVLMDSHLVPTFGQFKYWFYKERNLKKEISLRRSAKNYSLENRAIIGNSTIEAMGPGSIYQIDATVADVYLVSRYNKNWIIGRPIVYAVIDVFSRMVTGIYIGLEGPSWIGAMMALANASTDKVQFCSEYDIHITEDEWPVHFLPETIIADRGELEGKNIENLISALHIKVQNTASYRADWKGIVEQYFRTVNLRVKPFLPGFINEDYRQRGGRDYRLDATLNIFQFTQIIIKCVLYHNNQHYLMNYNREEMMISDEVEPIPIKLWHWGIQNRAGKLRFVPEDIVKLNLMPRDIATVTAQGIKFKDIYYGSEVALKEYWFEKARNKGSWKIDICYDPRNMNYIYIPGSDNKSFEKCFLLKHEERYLDKSYEEIEYLIEKEKIELKQKEEEELQSKVDLMSEIEEIVKEAKRNMEEDSVSMESKAKRIKGIKNNRKVEKILNREDEAFELDKHEKEDGKVISINKSEEEVFDLPNDLELLKKKQKERFNGKSK